MPRRRNPNHHPALETSAFRRSRDGRAPSLALNLTRMPWKAVSPTGRRAKLIDPQLYAADWTARSGVIELIKHQGREVQAILGRLEQL